MIKTVRGNAAQRGRSASDDVLQRLLRKGHLGRRVNTARSQRPAVWVPLDGAACAKARSGDCAGRAGHARRC